MVRKPRSSQALYLAGKSCKHLTESLLLPEYDYQTVRQCFAAEDPALDCYLRPLRRQKNGCMLYSIGDFAEPQAQHLQVRIPEQGHLLGVNDNAGNHLNLPSVSLAPQELELAHEQRLARRSARVFATPSTLSSALSGQLDLDAHTIQTRSALYKGLHLAVPVCRALLLGVFDNASRFKRSDNGRWYNLSKSRRGGRDSKGYRSRWTLDVEVPFGAGFDEYAGKTIRESFADPIPEVDRYIQPCASGGGTRYQITEVALVLRLFFCRHTKCGLFYG